MLKRLFLCVALFAGVLQADDTDVRRREPSNSAVNQNSPPIVVATPGPPVVPVDSRRGLGSPDAKVALVEFADYQCPYCRAFHVGTWSRLNDAYVKTGKVRYFYKEFPLASHSQAFPASIAAQCAGAQGKYWEMQDLLYAEQARLGAELFAELADELKLDKERYNACLKSNGPRRIINSDMADGKRLQVSGTPSFVIGRIERDGQVTVVRVSAGAPTFESFAQELDALLK